MKNQKVYLVTGGAGGIGSAICLKIAEPVHFLAFVSMEAFRGTSKLHLIVHT